MNRIESLLRKEIGLDAASIGSSAIERTVRLRMKNLHLKNSADYEQLLDSSRAELDELVEAVVVTETWFFRDRDPFNAFLGLALEWLGQHPAGTLRVLSVPCSSGEEPYSLAIALLDAHILPDRFVINAVDISTHAVARAKQAVYGKNSFRGKELAFRDRHFRQTVVVSPSPPSTPLSGGQKGEGRGLEGGEGHKTIAYALNRHVRECVQFFRDNLLGDAFLAGHAPYDFIFCRNLLIYFDRATQVRALEKLHRLLAPQGVLFVGPAETPLVAGNGFVNANLAMAFACRKSATKTDPRSGNARTAAAGVLPVVRDGSLPPQKAPGFPAARQLPAPGRVPASAAARRPSATFTSGAPERASAAAAGPSAARPPSAVLLRRTGSVPPRAPSDLEAARQLADAGHLKEAATVCQAHLRSQGPSAQAYYLLGLLRDACGDPQAIEYYRKALYLEPTHYETLLQMSLLLEKTGDAAGARIFKLRAARAANDLIKS